MRSILLLLTAPLPVALVGGCFLDARDRDQAMDRDRDGFVAWQMGGDDCDDNAADVYPGAPESCLDDVDSDCDGDPCWPRQDTLLAPEDAWAEGAAAGAGLALLSPPQDFDGDGVAELLWTERGEVTGVFSAPLPLPEGPVSLAELATGQQRPRIDDDPGVSGGAAGDLDGDGDAEVVYATGLDGRAQVYLLDALSPDGGPPEGVGPLRAPIGASAEPVGAIGTLGADGGVLLGFPGHPTDGGAAGQVYLLTTLPAAGAAELVDVAAAVVVGDSDGDRLGAGVASLAPDLDSDGLPDVLVVASDYRPDLSSSEARDGPTGGAFGFPAPLSGVVSAADASFLLTSSYDNARITSVHGAGDVNGDGHDDVGAYYGSGSGDFVLLLGPLSGAWFADEADLKILGDAGETVTYGFGARWSPAGDLDGDGFDDVLVGAPDEGTADRGDGPLLSGATYAFYGPLTGVLSPDHAHARWVGAYERGMQAESWAFDADLDGRTDLLLSAPGAAQSAGALHLVWDAFGGIDR